MNFRDRIKGAFFGMALGDALGLGTEFMSAEEVKYYYPGGLRHFSQIIRDGHRCLWKRGEWTNDTHIVVMLAESIMEKGKLHLNDFAARLKKWGTENPADMTDFYHSLFANGDWAEHPKEVTHRIWKNNGVYRASNEALLRAVVIGMLGNPHLTDNAVDISAITHDDTRCSACSAIIAVMADSLLCTGKPADYAQLVEIANMIDPRTLKYLEIAHEGEFEDLEIDDENSLWFARKTMASALWAIWHCNSAEEVLYRIVDAGGDADTNAALAMGLAGLQHGYAALPDIVNDLIDYKRMEDVSSRFINYIENNCK